MLDWGAVLSGIPWWVYVMLFVAILFKVTIEEAERRHKQKRKYNYKQKLKKESKNNQKNFKKTKLTNQQKKEKGVKYEIYISNIYKNKGYTIAEHGKDNGIHDKGIDIIAKKGREILFIQCKDWNINNEYKITHKDIQYIRMNVRDYLHINPMFQEYNWKILYVTSDNIFHKSAYYKINEHDNEIENKIIPMKYDNNSQKDN